MNSVTPSLKPSPRFFFPKNGKLFSYSTLSSAETRSAVQEIDEKLYQLATETHHPRLITRLAIKRKEYRIGVYKQLGEKELASELRKDLLYFQSEQENSESPYLTFIAFFSDSRFESEGAFEMALWKQFSYLMTEKEFADLWSSHFNSIREENDIRLQFDGLSYSVIGMHPYHSKESRRFFAPILVFNLFEQIEQMKQSLPFRKSVASSSSSMTY